MNIATPTAYSRNWALPSLRVLTTHSVKCEKPILTWTYPRLKLKIQLKPPSYPSPWRILRSFLLEEHPLVMGNWPKPRTFNLLWMKPISQSML